MRSIRVITNERTTQEGDGRDASVTLFWLALATLVATCFLYTYRELQPVDRLVSYVPANATAYVHFRSIHPETRQQAYALFDIPTGLEPDEVASFRLVDADGVGHWSTILAWNDITRIDAVERRVIAETWVSWLDGRTFVIPDDEIDNAPMLRAVRASGASLDTGAVANGLRQMRSIVPVQGYIDGLALPDGSPSTTMVFGTTFGATGSSMTILLPMDGIRMEKPLLGMDVRNGASSQPRDSSVPLALPDALVHRRTSGLPATPDILISGLSQAARDYGTPADLAIEESAEHLFGLLKPPFTLSIGSEGAALHLPKTAPGAILYRIDDLLAKIFPSKRSVTLPDGSTAQEFFREAKISAFVAEGYNRLWPLRISKEHPSGLSLFMTPDEGEGTILADSLASLEAVRPLAPRTSSVGACETLSRLASESVTLRDLSLIAKGATPFTADPLTRLGLTSADFYRIGDDLAIVCGYGKQLVDN